MGYGVGVCLLGCDEFGKEVRGSGGWFSGLRGRGDALLETGASKACNGEGRVYKAVLRSEEVKGVLEEEKIKERDLANGCNVAEEFAEVGDYTLDILVALEETVALRIRHITDDVEGIELEPTREVADRARGSIEFVGLREEDGCGAVDEGLVLDER